MKAADIPGRPALHQLVPVMHGGDAISNYTRWIRDSLREHGYHSEIFAEAVAPDVRDPVLLLSHTSIPPDAGLIYHHCIGTHLTHLVARHPGPKTMIYHNITPPEFFAPYNPAAAEIMRVGRSGLPGLAADYTVAYGDSGYNVDELRNAGFRDCRVLPIPVFPDRWTTAPDAGLMADLNDDATTILFVGRVAPNKAQHHLVEAFYHYLCMDPKARLILCGSADMGDAYVRFVRSRIAELGLGGRVTLFGQISEAKLHALYRSADLLWSMSEHEGFCLPLLEAMWFDIPVLAYKSSAVPETLRDAGLMFDDKSDLRVIAALAKLLTQDQTLRFQVLAAQQRRRQDFLAERVKPQLHALAQGLVPLLANQSNAL